MSAGARTFVDCHAGRSAAEEVVAGVASAWAGAIPTCGEGSSTTLVAWGRGASVSLAVDGVAGAVSGVCGAAGAGAWLTADEEFRAGVELGGPSAAAGC
jgi:hypothetical protein